MTYNCTLIEEDGAFTVEFPDLPNIMTYGRDKEEALYMAQDALNAALASDVARGILPPSPVFTDGHAIPVAAHIETAIQLRDLRGPTPQAEIAARMGITYQAYQRLENPLAGNPTVKTLEKVARAYGKRLELNIR
ncbi:MAG: type II toxin-antitoxin system HicB family antitoxin [Spirochaetaceae bacterium]|nr:MAG: type II toxin-antitoxin system HicB family antitoxin [Spirochaetaceae bacterium]